VLAHVADRIEARLDKETMKRTLKRIGNFYELGYDADLDAPRLSEARGKRSPMYKEQTVRYLSSGKIFVFSPGYEKDVFDPTKLAGTCSILTDGIYMWQKQIAYYVEHYDIELPLDFEAHMRSSNWTISEEIDISQLKSPGSGPQ